MILRKVDNPILKEGYEDGDSCLDSEIVEIIQFNYDGKGNALLCCDNQNVLEYLGGEDLDFILLSGYYELQKALTRKTLVEKFPIPRPQG